MAQSMGSVAWHTHGGSKHEGVAEPFHTSQTARPESLPRAHVNAPASAGKKPYQCTICTKAFVTPSHLALHVCTLGASQKSARVKYKCRKPACGKSFPSPAQLARHVAIHVSEKPFKCSDCGRCFGRSSHLEIHRRLHTGEKPFKCGVCGKLFTQKSGLIVHVRQHTGEKPYKCDKCGDAFRTSANLLAHQAVEAGGGRHACASCNKSFKTVAVLREHEKVHRFLKTLPAACGVCTGALTDPIADLHPEPGTAPPPFLLHCKVCNLIFTDLEEFEKHCESHLSKRRSYKVEDEEEFVFGFVDEEDEEDEAAGKKKNNTHDPPFRPHIATSATRRYVSEVSTRSRARNKD